MVAEEKRTLEPAPVAGARAAAAQHDAPRELGPRNRWQACRWLLSVAVLLIVAVPGRTAKAYTPESPLVLELIDRGVAFMHTQEATVGTSPEGIQMLLAYAVHKATHQRDDAVVQRGISVAQDLASKTVRELRTRHYANYEASLGILLLIDVNVDEFRPQIETLKEMLLSGQRDHGGFGYYSEQLGDISQTQYAMLAMWTLFKSGFEVETQRTARLVDFFLRTQDPTGGWGYKGRIAPQRGIYVPQDADMNPSLSMGAGGSLLMAGEMFGFWHSDTFDAKAMGLPPAFKPWKQEQQRRQQVAAAGVQPETILGAIGRLEAWLQAPTRDNHYRDYYKLYTLERYKSFLEVARGRVEGEPAWYNEGVSGLQQKISPSGGWGILDKRHDNDEPGVATAFAVLFLTRSTKRAIGQLSEGTLAGGYEIPKDTTQIRVEGTQIKGAPVANAVTDLLDLLEEDGADELDGQSIPDDLKLASEPEQRQRQLARLERLVRGSQSWQARRVAARLLGQSGELRVVPALIFALSDPDIQVKRYARDGLRMISRRFDGFGMPDRPTEQEVRAAQTRWRQWYQSLDPGYVFLDQDL